MKPSQRPRCTCSADATAIQFWTIQFCNLSVIGSLMAASRRGCEYAQPMSVGIECDKGVTEVHIGRRLRDAQPAAGPCVVQRGDLIPALDGEGDLAAAAKGRRC